MNEGAVRRSVAVLILLSLLFGAVGARLAWVQLGPGRFSHGIQALSRSAVQQRTDNLVIDDGRGRMTDRNGQPLAGIPQMGLAAFPSFGMPRGDAASVAKAAAALGVSADEWAAWLRELKEPQMWRKPGAALAAGLSAAQIAAIEELQLSGIAVLPYRSRYPDDADGIHAIGYVYGDRKTGGAGLEKSLDRFLRGTGPTVVSRLTDAGRRPLHGLGLRVVGPGNPHYPLQVRTTLDAGIQQTVEEALEAAGVQEGAAVVLDAANADVLAMVSKPDYRPGKIGAPGTDERNHAITAYPPGSVFKAVTLAAALESGASGLRARFRCDGEYSRYGLRCWRPGGHGDLTLEEAFADSCNVVFAALAEKMDPAWIQITAERLGFGRAVGWHADTFVDGKPLRLLGEEENGMIFRSKSSAGDGGVRTGTGIGQRDVRITPLQAANLAVTLLHGGRVAAPRIVAEIRYADGGLAARLQPQQAPSRYGSIRPETAESVLRAMRSVVTDGTARGSLGSSRWPLAGKSGTAELAGRQKARNDHWFVGYGPAQGTPRYAVAILIENQPAGLRNRAAAVFGDVMERLRLWEVRNLPQAKLRDPAGKA